MDDITCHEYLYCIGVKICMGFNFFLCSRLKYSCNESQTKENKN